MNTTGVLNGYHGCGKWASGKRNGVAKRGWALWRCVFVCVRGYIRWHLKEKWLELLDAHYHC